MIVLCGHSSGPKAEAVFSGRPHMGVMMSPTHFSRRPWCTYACDNDVFSHRDDAGWWKREGETAWLKMLDKLAADKTPLFCVLPDVVADWPRTLARAHHYREELAARNLPIAVALQDGCHYAEALALSPRYVFVGGSTAWKWAQVESVTDYFHSADIAVHVGRVSGPLKIRTCLRVGVDSCDGTGWFRHPRVELSKLFRELDQVCLTI